jgi:hypothetical protein
VLGKTYGTDSDRWLSQVIELSDVQRRAQGQHHRQADLAPRALR